jgi:hypothetical protein
MMRSQVIVSFSMCVCSDNRNCDLKDFATISSRMGFEFPKECVLDLLFECVRTTEKVCGLIITSTFHKR